MFHHKKQNLTFMSNFQPFWFYASYTRKGISRTPKNVFILFLATDNKKLISKDQHQHHSGEYGGSMFMALPHILLHLLKS